MKKTFGKPAPKNFNKEVEGPGWEISEETHKALEEWDNRQRDSLARLERDRRWMLFPLLFLD